MDEQQMLDHQQKRVVINEKQSRMSREDIFEAMAHWKLLRDAGAKTVTCQRKQLDFSCRHRHYSLSACAGQRPFAPRRR
jgi:hypothetical protein